MYVLTVNQRDSREVGDMVDELIRRLRHVDTLLPFQRSVGDELIGVVADPHTAVDVALRAVRERRWNVGVGVGPLLAADGTPGLPDSQDLEDVTGPGLAAARQAVEAAAHGQRIPVAVSARNAEAATEAEAVLRLIGQLVWTRTDAEWRVLDLMVPGVRGQQKLVAAELGITTQAVSQAVQRSFWTEEHACRPAAARLLALADEVALPEAG
ncbi:transcriptional regulator KorA [Micrococcus lylae]|uniref:transcriptional regulator KorA n=1 Tax=Micrococcus lylae TaxID=1273 RepID=UPI0021A6C135|nr:transcriptional regulator KorA [Micrococcus lylae]MCT2007403.1 transcriptional regulator KorA [Micrococcus lylae]MCT2070364.1 transcriptional regulator KorA [Micrococcus lylae]